MKKHGFFGIGREEKIAPRMKKVKILIYRRKCL